MTPQFHVLRVAEIRPETPDAISLRFDVPAHLRAAYVFVQGQHLTLKASIDGVEVRRSYSICAGPQDDELRVAIKRVRGGVFSGFAHGGIKVGDDLSVMTPDGHFHVALDPLQARNYVAFVAGSGITPVLSIIRATLRQEPRSRFTLVYGNRQQADMMFHEALEDLKDRYLTRFRLYHLFSREATDVDLFNGRIDGGRTRALLEALIPPDTIDHAFVCGPGAMIDEVEAALIDAGVPRDRIHAERFGVAGAQVAAPASAQAGDAPRATITVVLDGVRRDIDFHDTDRSILDAALRAGLDLPFSCKGGMCCTCRARKLEGEVRMDRNFSLDARDLAAGFVLTCQSHPLTDRVTVSFDDR